MTKQRARQRAAQRKAKMAANENKSPIMTYKEADRWMASLNPENLYIIAGDTEYRKTMPAILGKSIITHSTYSAGGGDWGFTLCRVSAEKPDNLQGLGLFEHIPAEDISTKSIINLLAFPLGYSDPFKASQEGMNTGKLSSGSYIAMPELCDRKLPIFYALNSKNTETFKRDVEEVFNMNNLNKSALKELFGANKFDDWDEVAWSYPTTVLNLA